MNSKFPVEKNRTNNLCDKAIKESIIIKIIVRNAFLMYFTNDVLIAN